MSTLFWISVVGLVLTTVLRVVARRVVIRRMDTAPQWWNRAATEMEIGGSALGLFAFFGGVVQLGWVLLLLVALG